MSTTDTVKEELEDLGLSMDCELISGDGPEGQSHWRIRLQANGQSYETEFHMGSAPTLEDVMSCLTLDSQHVLSGESFELWREDMGLDDDSRKNERIYNACRESHYALLRMGLDMDRLVEIFQDY